MSHEVAKLLLEHAGTFLERAEAVRSAMKLGMPYDEIEAYLDWLDLVREKQNVRGSAKGRGKTKQPDNPDPPAK